MLLPSMRNSLMRRLKIYANVFTNRFHQPSPTVRYVTRSILRQVLVKINTLCKTSIRDSNMAACICKTSFT